MAALAPKLKVNEAGAIIVSPDAGDAAVMGDDLPDEAGGAILSAKSPQNASPTHPARCGLTQHVCQEVTLRDALRQSFPFGRTRGRSESGGCWS